MEEAGNAASARCVGLEYVHGAGVEHASEIPNIKAVLPGGDIQTGRCAITQQPESVEVIGRHRFFEPGHTAIAELLCELERLLSRVPAIGVHEQLDLRPDRLARRR